MMRTLFLQAPSFDGFDGGAGARYQMRREIQSFWFPTWLAQPAALVADSKLIAAPRARRRLGARGPAAAPRGLAARRRSPPSFAADWRTPLRLTGLRHRGRLARLAPSL